MRAEKVLLASVFFGCGLFLSVSADEMGRLTNPDLIAPIWISAFIAFSSAILVFVPRARNLGYLLTGAWLSFVLFLGYITFRLYPGGFLYRGYSVTRLTILIIVFVDVLVAVWTGLVFFRENQLLPRGSDEKAAPGPNQEVSYSPEFVPESNTSGTIDDLTEKVRGLEKSLEDEKSAHKKILANRPYESQLAMSFAVSLCSEWLKQYPGKLFSLNNFQGNLDRALADIFGVTNRSCWLVELKRSRDEIKSEWRKPARIRQLKALQANPKIEGIANRCHWLGWGEVDREKGLDLRFSGYWKCENLEDHPEQVISVDVFASQAFLMDGKIGVSAKEMKQYLEFLFSAAGMSATALADSDSFAVLVFSWNPQEGPRCWCESMEFLGRVMERGLTEERERRLAQELKKSRDAYTLGSKRSPDYGIARSREDDQKKPKGPPPFSR